jgi:hypothetical protein
MWYCRYEVQVRQAYFFSAASVAGAFSGLLAYGISYMEGVWPCVVLTCDQYRKLIFVLQALED